MRLAPNWRRQRNAPGLIRRPPAAETSLIQSGWPVTRSGRNTFSKLTPMNCSASSTLMGNPVRARNMPSTAQFRTRLVRSRAGMSNVKPRLNEWRTSKSEDPRSPLSRTPDRPSKARSRWSCCRWNVTTNTKRGLGAPRAKRRDTASGSCGTRTRRDWYRARSATHPCYPARRSRGGSDVAGRADIADGHHVVDGQRHARTKRSTVSPAAGGGPAGNRS